MPVYEYRCKACGRTFEIEHGFHDDRPTTCQNCGGQLVRVFHPVGVVFKGSGFYKTDYSPSGARKDAPPSTKPDKAAAESGKAKPADGKPAGESKGDAAPKSGDSPKPK